MFLPDFRNPLPKNSYHENFTLKEAGTYLSSFVPTVSEKYVNDYKYKAVLTYEERIDELLDIENNYMTPDSHICCVRIEYCNLFDICRDLLKSNLVSKADGDLPEDQFPKVFAIMKKYDKGYVYDYYDV